jgi:diphthamide synthase subunit DPH2
MKQNQQKSILVCGSRQFLEEIVEIGEKLEAKNYKVEITENKEFENKSAALENLFETIKKVDSILVVNETKNGEENYIGASSFLALAVAKSLKKQIFVFHNLPENQANIEEIKAINPICLAGEIKNLDF